MKAYDLAWELIGESINRREPVLTHYNKGLAASLYQLSNAAYSRGTGKETFIKVCLVKALGPLYYINL
jgi:hypothetical protein